MSRSYLLHRRLYPALLACLLFFAACCNPVQAAESSSLFNTEEQAALTADAAATEQTIIVEVDSPGVIARNAYDRSLRTFMNSTAGRSAQALATQAREMVQQEVVASTGGVITERYDTVLNGFAVRTQAADLETIRNLPGVKRAYLERKWPLVRPLKSLTPLVNHSGPYIGSAFAHEAGYSGDGQAIAILDTGLDIMHPSFNYVYPDKKARYTAETIRTLLNQKSFSVGALSSSVLYKNPKIPFAFDYANNDTDVTPTEGHGIHVAGIAAGYDERICGVAPNAQLFIMKVFADGGQGAGDAAILAALDDAAKFGVDAINMSLGTPAGFSADADATTNEVYANVRKANITLAVAAGNNGQAGEHSPRGTDQPPTDAPQNGLVASPSTYAPALSVASINNLSVKTSYFMSGEKKIPYVDSQDAVFAKLVSLQNLSPLTLVPVGEGQEEAYEGKNLQGKVALVRRGGLYKGDNFTFADKERIAKEHGAIAMIVYDHSVGELPKMVTRALIPSVSISKSHGEWLLNEIAAGRDTIVVSGRFYADVEDEFGGRMSNFSSWGPTPELKLKPEITAPGGSIYSAWKNDKYTTLSGTSMASPHVAAASVLLRQRLQGDDRFAALCQADEGMTRVTENLLMSTAAPQTDENDVFYSPRRQGAGLVQLKPALQSTVFLSAADGGRPKAECGMSTDGTYRIDLRVENVGHTPAAYHIHPVVMSEALANWQDKPTMGLASRILGPDEYNINGPTEISVPANSHSDISLQINLTDAGRAALSPFTNGIYIDGFIRLEPVTADTATPPLNMPFLGFYGDWSQAPVFDADLYSGKTAARYASFLATSDTSSGEYAMLSTLGNNYCLKKDDPGKYRADRLSFNSSNKRTEFSPSIGLLRNADRLSFELRDAEGTLLYQNTLNDERKTYYDASHNAMLPSTDHKDMLEELDLAEGDYEYTITAVPVGSTREEKLHYTLNVDNTLPHLVDKKIVLVDGKRHLRLRVADNFFLMGYVVTDELKSKLIPETYLPQEKRGETMEILLPLEEGPLAGKKAIRLALLDYASNEFVSDPISTTGPAEEDETLRAISLNWHEKALTVGEETDLIASAVPDTADLTGLQFTSSKPEIAAIDAKGHITAKAAGDTVLRAAIGNISAEATLHVRDAEPEVPKLKALHLNWTKRDAKVGDTLQLNVQAEPADAALQGLHFTSSDEKVASIDKDGRIKALAPGHTVLRVSVGAITAEATLHVSAKEQPADEPALSAIKLSWTDKTLAIGKSAILRADPVPEEASLDGLVFTSSDKHVAIINADGIVRARHAGTTTLTAQVGKLRSSARLTVEKNPETDDSPDSIFFRWSEKTIAVDEALDLDLRSKPDDLDLSGLHFESSNDSVASVNKDGRVYGEAPGSAIITASLGDLSDAIVIHVQQAKTTQDEEDDNNDRNKKTITHRIVFQDGDDSYSVQVDDGARIYEPTAPQRDNQRFLGWFNAKQGGQRFDFTKKADTDLTLYAQWEPLNPTPATPSTDKQEPPSTNDGTLPFLDVRGHWAANDIARLYREGLIAGRSANHFAPDAAISRAEFVALLCRYADAAPTGTATTAFYDVPANAWYAPSLAWASANGLVAGYTDGSFQPQRTISREEMAAFIARFIEWQGRSLPDVAPTSFSDANAIQPYARDVVNFVARKGLMGGLPGNVFAPQKTATRAETAAILARLLDI